MNALIGFKKLKNNKKLFQKNIYKHIKIIDWKNELIILLSILKNLQENN